MAVGLPWRRRENRRPFPASGVVIVFLLGVVMVGGFALQRNESHQATFNHALPAWHQLTNDDIRSKPNSSEAALVGRYTTKPVEEGQALDSHTLGPALPAGALDDQVVTLLPKIDQMASVLSAGDMLDLRVAGTSARICPARVLVIETSKDREAIVVVAIAATSIGAFDTMKDQGTLVPLRVWGYADGLAQPPDADLCRH